MDSFGPRTTSAAKVRMLLGAAAVALIALFMACSSGDETALPPSTGGAGGGTGTGGDAAAGAIGGSTGTGGEEGCVPECPAGEVCEAGQCVPGCGPNEPCVGELDCCDGACVDLSSDVNHCGTCDTICPQPPNIAASCVDMICTIGVCDDGYYDCDGDAGTGCEESEQCACDPGTTQPCYPGPPNTAGVGECAEGYRTCNAAGTAYSLCYDFVLPAAEICANNVDEDCSGAPDDVPDVDGDGWTRCDNDCCETAQDCADPAKVNPGAFEFVGNGVDDDCDANSSDSTDPPPCSTAQDFNVTPNNMAEAMDLCQFTTANEPLPTRKWGVINASFRTPAGANATGGQLTSIQQSQAAVMVNYGSVIVPQLGPTMGGISSGWMRDEGDSGYAGLSSAMGSNQQPPASYLAAHGGQLPASQGCAGVCPAGSGANDGVNLRLDIRVPTNALSFAYQFRFFSYEYWNYSCTQYNDFYLALLQTGANGIPADGNISFDSLNNPVSVNNGFFEVCNPHWMFACMDCPNGNAELQGTGHCPSFPSSCTGGGTVWLQTTAPVVPGETMVLELMVFDVSDQILDSLSLLDAFEWSIDASGVGTGPPG